jgi:anti-anti-sigma factor
MHEAAPSQPFHLEIEDRGATVYVCCHGRLVAGLDNFFYKPVCELIPSHQRIILDLSHLTHMDSMGLGALVRIYVSARSKGCSVELRNLGQKVRDLLIMTNLLPAFTITGERDIRM